MKTKYKSAFIWSLSFLTAAVILFAFWSCCTAEDIANDQILVRSGEQEVRVRVPVDPRLSHVAKEKLIAQRIKSAILDVAIHELNITVPDAVLSHSLDLYFKEAGMTEKGAAQIAFKMRQVVDALKLVVISKQDQKRVYETTLKGVVSPEEWKVWEQQYQTQEKIEQLEQMIPTSIGQMKAQTRESLKKNLATWVLFYTVTRNIGADEKEIQDRYHKLHPDRTPPLANVRKEIAEGIIREKQEELFHNWWLGKVAGTVVIIPSQYQAARQYLSTLSMPFLPPSVLQYLKSSFTSSE